MQNFIGAANRFNSHGACARVSTDHTSNLVIVNQTLNYLFGNFRVGLCISNEQLDGISPQQAALSIDFIGSHFDGLNRFFGIRGSGSRQTQCNPQMIRLGRYSRDSDEKIVS